MMTERIRLSFPPRATQITSAALAFMLVAGASGGDWPLFAHDHHNTNHADGEHTIAPNNAAYLRRAWETFNDDALSTEPAPSGFVLEGALGLVYPDPVVGVIGSPIVRDGTIYYTDELGTVFARDAATGLALNAGDHWTTTLSDPDYDAGAPPLAPDLFYTAPIVTDAAVWLVGSFYGQVHLLDRWGGAEHDFDPDTPGIQPFILVPDRPVSSVLGDPILIRYNGVDMLIVAVNVIVNDALFQGGETGLFIAYDVTDPAHPVELWRRRTIDINPDTGVPYGTGVSAGSGLAVDFDRGLIFGGTSQNTSAPYPEYPDPDFAPPGYIDRGDSLFAMDLETGEFVWTNQFHQGDVFDLNEPVSTGPNRPDGPRDADLLAPPVLFRAEVGGHMTDLVGDGSKGGLFRVVNRDTGETVWERQISNPTGIGGIQGGSAFADGVIYVAGYEGIDDGFSDAQFGVSIDTGIYPNAFFATFSPAFWADVEDTAYDGDPATGMRTKVYALDAATGQSLWHFPQGFDYVSLPAGASLRHVTIANGLLYVATSSGQLFVLSADDGSVRFCDQTPDLNDVFDLGLGKPHHASMNGGTVIANGMVYVPYGAQNNPSGGVMAYELNRRPEAADDLAVIKAGQPRLIDALGNDTDPNGDALRFIRVAGAQINLDDGVPDVIDTPYGTITVVNPGDDATHPDAGYLILMALPTFSSARTFDYVVEDLAPSRIVNGVETDEPNPTHTALAAGARVYLLPWRPSEWPLKTFSHVPAPDVGP
ncbi:MAG: PQQ-binding-like beta-propeller repeat protein [Phycisphaeraceae bacterium]|nr:MAG: PQQ-binding-like beta-propeller repeat protein [Phycisphaeraceae bacterium]